MAKTVLITGGSGGIGAAAARLFARAGWKTAIHYHRQRDRAESLARDLCAEGHHALAFGGDLKSREESAALCQAVRVCLGPVDALVHSAGVAQQKLFTDLTEEDWDGMFDLHVKGAFHCAQAVLPSMIDRQSGAIVLVSSMWGQVGASCEVHYSAAKAALIGMTKALAKEVGPSGVRVNCVAPGVIDTEMNQKLGADTLAELAEETPLGTLGTADEVAEALLFLCSERASFITGQVLGINGGFII